MTIKNYNPCYDYLRIIACFLVIVNHSIIDSIYGHSIDLSTGISTLIFFVSKIAVPIFLMISGALLLRKDYSYKDIAINKFFRTCCALLLGSLFVFIFIERKTATDFYSFLMLIKEFGGRILHEPFFKSYWYLYTLLGLYMMLPLLRKLMISMKAVDFKYVFIVCLIFTGLLPTLNAIGGFPTLVSTFRLSLFTADIGYMLFGYYISNYIQPNNLKYEKISLGLFIVGLSLNVSYTLFIEYPAQQAFILTLDGYARITTMLMSASLFYYCYSKTSSFKLSEKHKNILINISEATFGIYLIHGIVFWMLVDVQTYLFSNLPILIGCLIFEIIAFIVSFIIIKILFYIPGFRFILNARKQKQLL